MSKEEKFWNWFKKNSDRYLLLDQVNMESLFAGLNQEIKKIDRNLTFEFSSLLDNGRREFVVSADGIRASFPSVTKLVQAAPTIPNWDIIAFRQPKASYRQIKYKGVILDFDDVYFRYGKDRGKIAIELHIKDFVDCKEWIATTFLLLDILLGEFDTEMHVSSIERKKLDEHQIGSLHKIEKLPDILNEYKKEYNN